LEGFGKRGFGKRREARKGGGLVLWGIRGLAHLFGREPLEEEGFGELLGQLILGGWDYFPRKRFFTILKWLGPGNNGRFGNNSLGGYPFLPTLFFKPGGGSPHRILGDRFKRLLFKGPR